MDKIINCFNDKINSKIELNEKNKDRLENEKIILFNKVPFLLFKERKQFNELKEESIRILKLGIINNINDYTQFKFYSNSLYIFYDYLYNCLINMFKDNNREYCNYQTNYIITSVANTLFILQKNNIIDINVLENYKKAKIIYDLILNHLSNNNDDGIFSQQKICNLACKNCKNIFNVQELDDSDLCCKCKI